MAILYMTPYCEVFIHMSTSESQIKANKKYHAKFERIYIRVSKEEKERIEEHSAKMNESVNAFVQRAIRQTIEQDDAE